MGTANEVFEIETALITWMLSVSQATKVLMKFSMAEDSLF